MERIEINVQTGERTVIPYTDDEVAAAIARRDAEQAEQAKDRAREVLTETNQAVLDAFEFGLPIPADIAARRAAARAVLGG